MHLGRLVTGLTLVLALLTALAAPAPAAGEAPEPKVSKEFAKNAMTMTALANTFRLSASADVDAAVAQWGSPAFKQKWKKEVEPFFGKAENIELHDFFSSAVIWIGRATGKKAVIGFYNPWMDGLLLVVLDASAKAPAFTDFRVISGETWGGRSDAPPERALALYAGGEILTVALAQLYSEADLLFRKRYPIKGETVLLPEEVAKIVGTTGEELTPIKARMLFRMQMYRDYLHEKNRKFLMATGGLMKGLKAGDKAKLMAGLSGQQSKIMVDAAAALPAYIRKGLAPNFFGTGKGGAIVALVNPTAPRWVVVATVLGKNSERETDVAFEMFDLNTSTEILKLRKGGRK